MTAHCGKGQHPPTTIVHLVNPDHDRGDNDVDNEDDDEEEKDDDDDNDEDDR